MRTDIAQPLYNIEEYRLQVTTLLNELRSAQRATALRAAKRFRILEQWQNWPSGEIHENAHLLSDRDAQAVIARENGFSDWQALSEESTTAPIFFDTTRLFPASTDIFLNFWFHSYDEALKRITAEPDLFLFPYKDQFVVCEPGMLVWLRIDIGDPDWILIGHNWVKPADAEAKSRLAARVHQALADPLKAGESAKQ